MPVLFSNVANGDWTEPGLVVAAERNHELGTSEHATVRGQCEPHIDSHAHAAEHTGLLRVQHDEPANQAEEHNLVLWAHPGQH